MMAFADIKKVLGRKTTGTMAVIAIIASGCTQASDLNQGGRLTPKASVGAANTRPAAPLEPAPLTPVNQGALEPVQTARPTAPPKPTEVAKIEPIPETPTVEPTRARVVEANGQPVTRQAMLGFWDVKYQGTTCKMFLNLTPKGSNWRGGTLRCPDAVRSNIKAWNVKGKKVILYDDGGSQVATLIRNSNTSFSGATSAGGAITVARES